MTTLFSSEKYKFLHSRITVIVLAGVAIMKAFFVFAPYMMHIAPTTPGGVAAEGMRANFSGISGVMLMNGESMILILWFAAFVGFFVASEFQDGTIRNALSLGKRRTMIFVSKFLASVAALTTIFAVTILAAIIGNSVLYGFGDMGVFAFISYFMRNFFLQLLCHMPYAAVFCMFAFIGRSPGMSIILDVGYLIFNSFAASFTRGIPGAWRFFPDFYISEFSKYSSDRSFIVSLCLVSAAYVFLSCVVSCVAFTKSDVR